MNDLEYDVENLEKYLELSNLLKPVDEPTWS